MKKNPPVSNRLSGFTLIEVLIVISVFILFLGMVVINLNNIIPHASFNIDPYTIIADIKNQQLKSMTGDAYNNLPSAYGVYLEENRYIFFAGNTYQEGSQGNIIVNLPENLSLINITFPGQTIIFNEISGEINNFISTSNTFSVRNDISNQQKTISFNKLGVVTTVN